MILITEWVIQIIVFILIGTIIELLIPNNAMKKYINIVLGLLLLLILAKPIFMIFQVDVTSELNKLEQTLFLSTTSTSKTESLIESQKKDIQAEHDAYIWNEVRTNMMIETNPLLNLLYDAEITDISFVFHDNSLENMDNFDKIIVTVTSRATDAPPNQVIVPVNIDVEETKSLRTIRQKLKSMKTTLEEQWNLDKNEIEIIWEGGAF